MTDLEVEHVYGNFAGEPWDDTEPLSPASATSDRKVLLILLKSFIGTGVLFLPRAFLNGGIVFSCLFLWFVSYLSGYGMIILAKVNKEVPGSFGDMARILYGSLMEHIVVWSVALSQLGFCVAYFIFVCKNATSLFHCSTMFMIIVQVLCYIPLAMIRRLNKLAFISLVADFFILLGLFAVVYYSTREIMLNGIKDSSLINTKRLHLFVGTAMYAFEGVGLILPIVHSMQSPDMFPKLLKTTLFITTIIYTVIAGLGLLAFGSNTAEIVLLNLPQSTFALVVKFLYLLAIMGSWPLVLFPAMRIIENTVLPGRDGAVSLVHKWQKNLLRALVVIILAVCANLCFDHFESVIAWVGGFACIPLSFIYPALLSLKSSQKSKMDYFMLIFGILSTVFVVYEILL